jgi:NADH-quinone oxidoreductase subunit D
MGYYVASKGDLGPFRTKIRTPSFSNISVVPWVMQGVYVPDVITILASLYFILGDIDRCSFSPLSMPARCWPASTWPSGR